MEIHLRTMGVACHMGSHTSHLPPNTSEHTARLNPSQWSLVLDLPTPEGWKAEFTYSFMCRITQKVTNRLEVRCY